MENSWIRDIWLFAQVSRLFTHPPQAPSQGCPQHYVLEIWETRDGEGAFQVEWFFEFLSIRDFRCHICRQGGNLRENQSDLTSSWGKSLNLGLWSSFSVSMLVWHRYHSVNEVCFSLLDFFNWLEWLARSIQMVCLSQFSCWWFCKCKTWAVGPGMTKTFFFYGFHWFCLLGAVLPRMLLWHKKVLWEG